jgi:hypothetical protein
MVSGKRARDGSESEETHTSFLDIFLAFFASGVMYVQASPMMPQTVIERRKGTSCEILLRFLGSYAKVVCLVGGGRKKSRRKIVK